MNNKRQTIWLVSMLSLMVILSAYYLFTEDVPKTDNANGITEQTNQLDATQASGTNSDGIEITQVDTITGETSTATDDSTIASDDTATGLSPEDEAVIKDMTNLKGAELLDQISLSRKEKVDKTADDLSSILADTKNHSPEEAQAASEQLRQLEDTNDRITALEDKLLQEFDNAVVSEEDVNNYKIIVLSDKLEKKQAVSIVDLATKELNTSPDHVTVQVVTQ
ncbi:SpoIIIAH-like family protein [Cohnella yongneupensis]|uniref:SpoIIIAH-like family protein n=1 Tax=Cohnella yongneupensis TaxID=425006 RepID=A0ABW0R9Q4_9BACL